MEENKVKSSDMMQRFFEGEQQKALNRYQILNQTAEKGKVLFTGSSLMEQFPINEMLMTNRVDLIAYNRGIGGFTSDDMLAHMDEMVFGTEPSVIFMNIGTNDIGSADYTLEHLIGNYEKILDQIKKKLRNVKVFLMAYYPVNDSPEVVTDEWVKRVLTTRTNKAIAVANTAVNELADRKNCSYIDLNQGLTDEEGRLKKEFTIEGIHMYPNGYQIVFENLMPIMQSL